MLRRAMLGISVVMAGVTLYQVIRRDRPVAMRVVGGVSLLLTVMLVAWSVSEFGL